MPILLNKISTKGGGGQKSPKSCLRRDKDAAKDSKVVQPILMKNC